MQSTNSNHSDEIILKAVFLSQIWLLNSIMHYNYERKPSSTKYTVSSEFFMDINSFAMTRSIFKKTETSLPSILAFTFTRF